MQTIVISPNYPRPYCLCLENNGVVIPMAARVERDEYGLTTHSVHARLIAEHAVDERSMQAPATVAFSY
jgi:hypothetical protein